MNSRKVIDAYFEQRELKHPEALEALLFLLSEVGELTEAYLRSVYDPDLVKGSAILELLEEVIRNGNEADALVSGRKDWVRNNGRAASKADLDGEIADVFMMLDRLACSLNKRSPAYLLTEKMRTHGFDFSQL